MTRAPVTVVTCLYGDRGHERFVEAWLDSIDALNTQPYDVIIASDQRNLLHLYSVCTWNNPSAYYLQQAVMAAETEWVWILGIDDTALPDALDGIEDVKEDVWQMGYHRSDGVTHIPPQLTGAEYLLKGNCFTAASAIRTNAFRAVGGFPDIAFEDFGLWRRLAANGATFKSSGRVHYRYNLHEQTRTAVEFVPERVEEYEAEVLADA